MKRNRLMTAILITSLILSGCAASKNDNDKKVDEKTFEELTSITLDEFRSLRDGLIYTDEEGNEKQVPGLFDEIVFNSSIKEFLLLKNKLSDYISMKEKEDIKQHFDDLEAIWEKYSVYDK